MTRKNDAELMELLQEVFASKDGLKDVLELLANRVMEAELSAHVQAGRHERSADRKGYRNGKKPRKLKTRVGELNLQIPQSRNCEPYHPSLFARWQRSERALLVACAEMYFQGVSTRKVRHVLEEMCGLEISSSTVSRIASEVDEKLSVFRNRRLDAHEYPYGMMDARYEKVRVNGHVVPQAVLITAGVTEEGRREILDWRMGDSESEATWGEVFRAVKDRGMKGVKMITSDANEGIRAAMNRYFQGVSWQRCRVHFIRELCKKASWKDRKELAADIKSVFAPEDRNECLKRSEEMAVKWEGRYPKISKMLADGLEDCLTVCALPSEHRRRLHSTNMLEREMRELKRRTRVVGVFPNVASCDRLIGAQLMELDEKWQLEKAVYLNMEHLNRAEYRDLFLEVAAGQTG
jgi:putative transposase